MTIPKLCQENGVIRAEQYTKTKLFVISTKDDERVIIDPAFTISQAILTLSWARLEGCILRRFVA